MLRITRVDGIIYQNVNVNLTVIHIVYTSKLSGKSMSSVFEEISVV